MSQMVDRLDQGALPRQDFSNSYTSLYKLVQKALYRTHVEGQLKGDIIQDPASYVELDPDMAKTLLDQRQAVRPSTLCALLHTYCCVVVLSLGLAAAACAVYPCLCWQCALARFVLFCTLITLPLQQSWQAVRSGTLCALLHPH